MKQHSAKPRIFIGSSKERIDDAQALKVALTDAEIPAALWRDASWGSGESILECLERFLHLEHDFGAFIFRPDDPILKRKKLGMAVRDNVVLEAGLFMGRWGRTRTFLVGMSLQIF